MEAIAFAYFNGNTRLVIFELTILSLIIIALLFDYTIRNLLLVPSFTELENQYARQDTLRSISVIKHEQYLLGTLVIDWAEWNESYEFVLDRNNEYVDSNLDIEALTEVGINLLSYFLRVY